VQEPDASVPALHDGGADGLDGVPAYPESWVNDVALRDGHTVRVRPIRPADGSALERFHERQSPESIYFRFFSPRPRLSARDVHHFTHVDHVDRVAFVAEVGGELVGVARYERYSGTDTAEVAFFIDDGHQGRGLGTLMLEYLAAAGRERGLRRFTASTLPSNRRMLAVFTAAGYDVATHLEEGVIEVAFDIRATDDVLAAIDRRERVAEAASVQRLLRPGSVAVVRVDADGRDGVVATEVVRNLVLHGFTGTLLPVSGADGHLFGVPVRRSVADLPDGVDLVVIAAPPEEVPDLVARVGARGAGAAAVLSSLPGVGRESWQAEIIAAARRCGMRVLGPDCLGLVNTDRAVRLHATPVIGTPPVGGVGMMSESGSLAAAFIGHAAGVELGVSTFVAAGRPADVTASDLLSYWSDDAATKAALLAVHAEGIGGRFVRSARGAAMTKPVAALALSPVRPVGPADVRGTAASSDRGIRRRALAAFRQSGVMAVDTLEELFDIGRLAADQPLPVGRGVAVVGDSAGAVALAAQACAAAGLRLPEVSGRTSSGSEWANPVYLTHDATEADVAEVLEAVAVRAEIHSLLVVTTPPVDRPRPDLAAVAADFGGRPRGSDGTGVTGAPLTIAVARLGDDGPPRLRNGSTTVPVFSFPERAARALGRLAASGEWRSAAVVHGDPVVLAGEDPVVAEVLATALAVPDAEAEVALDHAAQELVLAASGVTVIDRRTVAAADEAVAAATELGWPVALKAAMRDRSNRSALGGVAIDISTEEDLRATWERMASALGAGMMPAVVQRFVERGVDVGLRVRRHPTGPATVEVGLGGPSTPLDRWELGVLPLGLPDASALVAASSVGRVLTDPLDRVPLVDLVTGLASLVDRHDRVHLVEANPVVVSPVAAMVADVSVVVGDPVGELFVRRLD
jgi:acyl-CoA synthetase (NDP forming)/RimJ/RimL family protein N-acetyltransferase